MIRRRPRSPFPMQFTLSPGAADRPVVEQAKARLMRDGLSEPAAFGWLRRRAMDRRVRIGEVARTVLAGDGLRA